MKKNKVDYLEGTAKLTGAHEVTVDGEKKVTGKNIIIATGSRPRTIPGFEFDEKQVLSSTGALYLEKLPKTLIILGGGYIGMEFAHVMSSLRRRGHRGGDARSDHPQRRPGGGRGPREGHPTSGVEIMTSTKAEKLTKNKSGVKLEVSGADGKQTLEAEMLLVSVGRAPNTEDLGSREGRYQDREGFYQGPGLLPDRRLRGSTLSVTLCHDPARARGEQGR